MDEHNPPGFADRLRLLFEAGGFTTRTLGARANVSHGTIANWLTGKGRAGREEVTRVADVFGWTFDALYHGRAPDGVMDRVAELDAFRIRARRLAVELIETADAADEQFRSGAPRRQDRRPATQPFIPLKIDGGKDR